MARERQCMSPYFARARGQRGARLPARCERGGAQARENDDLRAPFLRRLPLGAGENSGKRCKNVRLGFNTLAENGNFPFLRSYRRVGDVRLRKNAGGRRWPPTGARGCLDPCQARGLRP